MKLPNYGYIGDNKYTHMWFPYFTLTVDYRLDNLFTYKSMGRPYRIIKRKYKQPKHKDGTNKSLPTTTQTLI